jgi:hypothetical protein
VAKIPRMEATSWQGPPRNVLGYAVPIQQFVARTDRTVVALHYVLAFPEGCVLTLRLAVQRASLDDSAWEQVLGRHLGHDPDLTASEVGLKFGVRFPDGSRATTVEHAFRGWTHPTDRPERPMLVEAGSDSSSNDQYYDSHQRLWLWPLPPSDPFEFVVEWQTVGLDPTSTTLDGTAIVRAADHARPFSVSQRHS